MGMCDGRVALRRCVWLVVVFLVMGGCQTSLTGYQSSDLTVPLRGEQTPGVPFRMTKPLFSIAPTVGKDGKAGPLALSLEWVTDPSAVYWVDIAAADMQENAFGINFDEAGSGNLTSVTSAGADQSKGFIAAIGTAVKSGIGLYVLAKAEDPTDSALGAALLGSSFQDAATFSVPSPNSLATPVVAGGGGALAAMPGSLEASATFASMAALRSREGGQGTGPSVEVQPSTLAGALSHALAIHGQDLKSMKAFLSTEFGPLEAPDAAGAWVSGLVPLHDKLLRRMRSSEQRGEIGVSLSANISLRMLRGKPLDAADSEKLDTFLSSVAAARAATRERLRKTESEPDSPAKRKEQEDLRARAEALHSLFILTQAAEDATRLDSVIQVVHANLVSHIDEFNKISGAALSPPPIEDGKFPRLRANVEAIIWQIDAVVRGLMASGKPGELLERTREAARLVHHLLVLLLRLDTLDVKAVGKLDALVQKFDGEHRRIDQLQEHDIWFSVVLEVLSPFDAMAAGAVRNAYWVAEIAEARKRLFKEVGKERTTVLRDYNAEVLAWKVREWAEQAEVPVADSSPKDTFDSLKKFSEEQPETDKRRKAKWFLKAVAENEALKAEVSESLRAVDAKLARDQLLIESTTLASPDVQERMERAAKVEALKAPLGERRYRLAEGQEKTLTIPGNLALLSPIHGSLLLLASEDWRGNVIRLRWEAFKQQQRIDVLGGATEEAWAMHEAEKRLYMALDEFDLMRLKLRLTEVLERTYLNARQTVQSVNPVLELGAASDKLEEIEAQTVKSLSDHIPELQVQFKVLAAKAADKGFEGSDRLYPRYLYYEGEDSDAERKAFLACQLAHLDLKDGEYIVLVERFGPQQEVEPPLVVREYASVYEGSR